MDLDNNLYDFVHTAQKVLAVIILALLVYVSDQAARLIHKWLLRGETTK